MMGIFTLKWLINAKESAIPSCLPAKFCANAPINENCIKRLRQVVFLKFFMSFGLSSTYLRFINGAVNWVEISLSNINYFQRIHVAVIFIFTPHTPNKRVVAGATTRVN